MVIPRKKLQRFCSVACYKINKKPTKINYNCPQCNNKLQSHQKKFCSKCCSAKFANANRSIESRLSQRESLITTLRKQGRARTDEKEIYWNKCRFKFSPYRFQNLTGFNLLIENGIYHYVKNPNGMCRDHILSIEQGWDLKIQPEIISHPANCQFLTVNDNSKKGSNSWITLDELKNRIKTWERHDDLPNIEIKKGQLQRASKDPQQALRFRYVIQNTITNEIFETNNITRWSVQYGLAKCTVYNKNNKWKIIEKYDLRTNQKLI